MRFCHGTYLYVLAFLRARSISYVHDLGIFRLIVNMFDNASSSAVGTTVLIFTREMK